MENKIKPSDLERQAAELHRTGKMPDLDTVLKAVAEARKKYRDQILAARKQPVHSGIQQLEQPQ